MLAQSLARERILSLAEASSLLASVGIWAFMSVVIVGTAYRLPLDRTPWFKVLLGHGLCAGLLAIVDPVVDVLVDTVLSLPPRGLTDRILAESFINLFSYAGVSAAGYAAIYQRTAVASRARTLEVESALSRARLDAVVARLRPHFLFNTLHSVSALVRFEERDKALDCLNHLSELLRYGLTTEVDSRSSWDKELEAALHYLNIEQLRFGDRLSIQLSSEACAVAPLVPTFVLQPLLENAIRHGVSRRRGMSTLSLRMERKDERLVVEVQEGATVPVQSPLSSGPDGFGLGLASLRSRLEHLYPTGEPHLLLKVSETGSLARVEIPWEAPR